MVNVSNKFSYVLFADDINILYPSQELETTENIVNKELHLIYAWLCTNKLSINLSKINNTDYVLGVPLDSRLTIDVKYGGIHTKQVYSAY